MNYSEFLTAFYVPEVGGGLIGFISKNTIPLFFIQNGLRDDYNKEFIEQSESTYTKWLTGARKPSSTFWAEAANKLYPRSLEQSLLNALNPAAFDSISKSFGLPVSPDNINKAQLAHAIAKQFAALATGRGQADNIISAEYNRTNTATISNNTFEPYLGRACQKLRWLKPLEEDAGLIKDLYVCNNLGKTAAAFPYRVRGNYIENATLPTLQHYDKHTETNHILIIGACGYGKTLMLQHLFLDAAAQASETKKLPVFAEIKDFMPRDNDLKTFLLNSIKKYDPDFSNDLFDELLTCGSVQILLDGLDEMDPQETRFFQQKLSEFQALYSQNQIIITSRQCAALRGIRLFSKLYIHPLTDEQVSTLIDKHLTALSDMDAKETIYAFMNPHTGYIKPNSFIATNPMLLTLLITKRHELQDMQRDMITFYACMYDALVRVHDLEKEAFGRFFHSVIDPDEFTEAFRIFCAISYLNGTYEFTHQSFEKYFKEIKQQFKPQNPARFTPTTFLHDVCSTACMMYEEATGVYYIDPGFQDYFFASYYYNQDSDATKAMAQQLSIKTMNDIRNLNALMMLHQLSPEKTEVCIILPLLKDIFDNSTDEQAFLKYLSAGFDHITFPVLDELTISPYIQKTGTRNFLPPRDYNHLSNIILALTQTIIKRPPIFTVTSPQLQAPYTRYATHFLAATTIWLREKETEPGYTSLGSVKVDIKHKDDKEYFDSLESSPVLIEDDNGNPVCFGYECTINPKTIHEDPELLEAFLKMCMRTPTNTIFNDLKDYYHKTAEKQRKNEYR